MNKKNKNTVNQEFKKLISEIKFLYNINQADIAFGIDVKKTYLSDMINGRVPVTDSVIKKLYELYSDVNFKYRQETFSDRISNENKNITEKIIMDFSKNKRLKQFYESKGLSQEEFAYRIGASQPYISAVVNNKISVGTNIINKLKSVFDDFNEYWFLTGKGEMLNNKELSKEDFHHIEDINVYEEKYKIIENPEDIPEPFKRWVKPFYPDMRVGAGMMNGIFPIATKYFILVPFSENVEFWLPVEGKSMIPRYNHNDLVGVSEIHYDGVFSKENYVVLLKSNSWHLKQVELIDDEFVWLNSYNTEYPPKKMSLDKIAKFFKVKMFIGNE